jgi:hypothetical protein
MLALILAFYSRADAQPRPVPIPCGQDIDAKINADPRGTPSRFVLGAGCTFVASATIVPSDGDEVVCAEKPTYRALRARVTDLNSVFETPAQDPTTFCTVAGNSSVELVFRPQGQGGALATVHFRGIKITGGNFTGSNGTGAGIAEGSMTDRSTHTGIEIMDNGAAGILSAKGTFDRVELTDNTNEPGALGVIGSGMKARHEVEVKNSYVHDTQGNGLWCDNSCEDSAVGQFSVHDNLVVNNGRAGIRWENVGGTNAGEALIQKNEVHGNSPDEKRGGISVRDAENAEILNNRFGEVTIGGVRYPPNARAVAIIASDSGRADRPNLWNIDIIGNILNGETIRGCELPDAVVDCSGNTP